MALFCNCNIASMNSALGRYGFIRDGAFAVENCTFAWVGQEADVPSHVNRQILHDLEGALVTPGLIDCHTHVVYGGDRVSEFEARLMGASYEEIARAGGGILSTMKATRDASRDALLASAMKRVNALIGEGVTTIEIKSGYGLTIEDEIKMLQVARQIAENYPIRVVNSWLAAHALPPEYAGCHDNYIAEVAIPGLAKAHSRQLVDSVDSFCEGIAFSTVQLEPYYQAAVKLNLPVKIHAEQLSHNGGTQLAAKYNALSADHVEYANSEDVIEMKRADMVAVLLPGAYYTLKETQKPPVDNLREADVPIALATDCNPGSSPVSSILAVMNLACNLFGLTPEEALKGITVNAAKALGKDHDLGQIAVGMRADFCTWSVDHPAELAYHLGYNPLIRRWFANDH